MSVQEHAAQIREAADMSNILALVAQIKDYAAEKSDTAYIALGELASNDEIRAAAGQLHSAADTVGQYAQQMAAVMEATAASLMRG